MSRPTTHRRERRRIVGASFGRRERCDWGAGDLPAPFAEGDLVRYPVDPTPDEWRWLTFNAHRATVGSRLPSPGDLAVIEACMSVDEGDAWFVRLTDLADAAPSARLRLVCADRSSWPTDRDDTGGLTLVDTADPDGLAERERLLAAGWTLNQTEPCPTCGRRP